MKPWTRIDPTTVTKVGWRTITTKTFRLNNGRVTTFDTVHVDGQQFVNVVALTTDNKVVVAEQFRPGPEKICSELPGGFVDEGESPEAAVLRELKEETGYVPESIELLGEYHKDTYINATWFGYIARGCVKDSEPTPEEAEEIKVKVISAKELINNAKQGKMTDQQTVLMAYDELTRIGESR